MRRVAIAIAVQALAQDGDSPEFIDDRRNADLDELGVVAMAVGDVRRGDLGGLRR